MFLRHTKRKKDGKEHRYWSNVENRRIGGGRVLLLLATYRLLAPRVKPVG
jgi:hypothetical protein